MEGRNELVGQLSISVMYMPPNRSTNISEQCFPAIEGAIKTVYKDWGPYSNRGGPYRLVNLFNHSIGPAWKHYAETFSEDSMAGSFCQSRQMICPRGKDGFAYLEMAIRDLILSIQGGLDSSRSEQSTLLATLESLRTLVLLCSIKRAKRISYGDETKRKTGCHEFCRFCGQFTELFASVRQEKGRESRRGLSGIFCTLHKKTINNMPNPKYLRAHRNYSRFHEVLTNLVRETHSNVYRARRMNGPLLSDFFSLVMAEIDPSQDVPLVEIDSRIVFDDPKMEKWEYTDIALIRDIARRIVDAGITDKWMKIIALLHSGLSQSEVARRLGVKRQDIWNILHSKTYQEIPAAFRFDRKRRS